MKTTKIDIKLLGMFNGMPIDKKGGVKLKILFAFEETANAIRVFAMKNQIIKLYVKVEGMKGKFLGEFSYGGMNNDKNGQFLLTLETEWDSLELTNYRDLMPLEGSQPILATYRLIAEIELEDEENVN